MKIFLILFTCGLLNFVLIADANANKFSDEALLKAVKHNNIKAAKKSLALRADVESRNMGSRTLLTFAAYNNYYEMVKLLLEHGADINRMDSYTYPLHAASDKTKKQKPSIKIIEYLIKHGADINAIDKKGQSPLSTAVKTDNYKVAVFLIEHGADPEIITPEGSILELSKKQRNLFMLKLISRAINKTIADKDNIFVKEIIKRYNDFFEANLSGNLINIKNTRTDKILKEMDNIYAKKRKSHLSNILIKKIAEKQESDLQNGKFIPSRLTNKYNFYELTYNYMKSRLIFYSNPIDNYIYILAIMFNNENNKWKINHIGFVKDTLKSGQLVKDLVKARLTNIDNNINYKMR